MGSRLLLIGALFFVTQFSSANHLADIRDEIKKYTYLQHAITDTYNVSNRILEATVCSDAIRTGKLNINRRYIICLLPGSGKYNIYIYSLDIENKLGDFRYDSVPFHLIPPSSEDWEKRISKIQRKEIPAAIMEQLVNSVSLFKLYSAGSSSEMELKAHYVDGPDIYMTIFEHQRIFNVRLSYNTEGDRKIINDLISISRRISDSNLKVKDMK